jgi:hypothetical protein
VARTLHINASTSRDRHAVVEELERLLGEVGAWITDCHPFSNVSLNVSFEISGSAAAGALAAGFWESRLQQAGLQVSAACLAALRETIARCAPDAALGGTVQITFFHQERDLRIPVPAIPG